MIRNTSIPCEIGFNFFLFWRFYLFIRDSERESERERERQRHRQREKQAPRREPNVGLDPGTPGSCPGLKAALNRRTTQAAPEYSCDTILSTLLTGQGKCFHYKLKNLPSNKYNSFSTNFIYIRQSPLKGVNFECLEIILLCLQTWTIDNNLIRNCSR